MKHLKHIILFIFSFLAIYYGVFYILLNTKIQNKVLIHYFDNRITLKKSVLYKALKEFPENEKFDFIFLGSSHCYRGLDPDQFKKQGYNTYNLGGSSQTPANAIPYIKKYIKQTNAVILEIYPVTLGLQPAEAYYDALSATNDPNILIENAVKVESFKALNLLLMKPLLNKILDKDTLKKCLFHRGFTTVNDSAINRNVEFKDLTLDKSWLNKHFSYLNTIYKICKKHKKQLILVYAPIPKKLKIINESVFFTKLYTFLNYNPDVLFYNYGRKHQLNDGFNFYDDDHLNASGVKMFNEIFINDLKRTEQLKQKL